MNQNGTTPGGGSCWLCRAVCLLLLSSVLPVSSTFAQETEPNGPADREGVRPVEDEVETRVASDVDEITVTGVQSDVTDIQNESSAITAFSMEELDRSEIVNIDKLAFNVPALHIGQVGSESIITLRGVGTENSTITGEAGLQFHVDGVNYSRPSAARVAFFDLEGLQVLRGPQGFEGGKNATAGHIQVTTRKPHADFEVNGEYQVGSFNQIRYRGAVNIPINEYVQTRLAYLYENRDGYQENLLLNDDDQNAFDADEYGLRGSIRFLPGEIASVLPRDVLFTWNYFSQGGVGPASELQVLPLHEECDSGKLGAGRSEPPWVPGRIITQFPNFAACNPGRQVTPSNPFDLRFFTIPATDQGTAGRPNSVFSAAGLDARNLENFQTRQSNRFWGWTGTSNWDVATIPLLGETQLKAIASFQAVELSSDGDRDGTDLVFFLGDRTRNTESWFGQLQWAGGDSAFLDWKLSLMYAQDESDSRSNFVIFSPGFTETFIDQDVLNRSYGASLNTNWHVLDDLTLVLGGRFTKDVKRDLLLRDNPPDNSTGVQTRLESCDGDAEDRINNQTGEPRPDDIPDGGTPECKATFRDVTGQFRAEWRPGERFGAWPSDETLIYGSVASGFKGGGFAAFRSGDYLPEHIWAYSLGTKNTFFDDRLTLNFESFFYHYRNLQLTVIDGVGTRTDNADAEIWGLELEYEMAPLSGLRIGGNIGYTNSEFTDYLSHDPVDSNNSVQCNREEAARAFVDLGCIRTQFAGNELSRAPELSWKVAVEYDFFLREWGKLTPRVQYYWQDDTWYRAFNRTPENSGPNCDVIEPRFDPPAQCGSIVNDLQAGYHQTDIKLIWASPTERWTAEAFVLNLEDEEVYQNVLVGPAAIGNPGFAWYGPPRTYGFRVGFRY